jgi:trk system potassium uptake protein TrkA
MVGGDPTQNRDPDPHAPALGCRLESPPVKAIIVGCGRVGSTLARRLDGEGHSVTVVDERVSAFNRLGDEFSGEMLVGTGIDQGVLVRAGIESCDCFAAVTNGDNRNLMAAQIAKVVFRVPRVITRIYDPIREEVYRDLGLETLCTTTIGSRLIHDYFIEGVNKAHAESAEAHALAVAAGDGTRA